MAPEFKLTPGAVIEPASGTVRDFTTPKLYKVTSQDGRWNKSYLVSVIETDLPTLFSFEDWKEIGKYEQPYEIIAGGVAQEIWSSGNAGYALTGGASVPSKFPTCSTPIAHGGRLAAKLETKSTGTFGSALNMPIAAGNLFIGTFDGMLATKNPMEATRFGLPFGKKPLRLKGYYSYVSAGNVTDKYNNLVIPEQRDSCQIYAVLYETDDNVECLVRRQRAHFAEHRRQGRRPGPGRVAAGNLPSFRRGIHLFCSQAVRRGKNEELQVQPDRRLLVQPLRSLFQRSRRKHATRGRRRSDLRRETGKLTRQPNYDDE